MSSAQVVIAEDEPELRSLIGEMLAQHGIDTLAAADGVAALKILTDNRGVSLLLSDVRMPRMGGYQLVEQAIALLPELKVVMITAYEQERPTAAAMQAREFRTLLKPFRQERLYTLVSEMLGRA